MEEGSPEVGAELADIDFAGIMKCIPHRYPMLLVDRLEGVVAYKKAIGIKNVTNNEPFFQGHFPNDPIMPGVLIIEAMAQTAGVLAVKSLGDAANGSLVYFMSVDNARFRRPVRPGDTIRLSVELQRYRMSVWKFQGRATVGDELAAESVFSAKVMAGFKGGGSMGLS